MAEQQSWRRVRVHVAGHTARGVPLVVETWNRWVASFVRALSEASGGGATIWPPIDHAPADGVWRGRSEPVRIIEAVMSNAAWHAHRASLEALTQRFLAATCQESVLITAEYLAHDEVSFVSCHDGEGVVACG